MVCHWIHDHRFEIELLGRTPTARGRESICRCWSGLVTVHGHRPANCAIGTARSGWACLVCGQSPSWFGVIVHGDGPVLPGADADPAARQGHRLPVHWLADRCARRRGHDAGAARTGLAGRRDCQRTGRDLDLRDPGLGAKVAVLDRCAGPPRGGPRGPAAAGGPGARRGRIRAGRHGRRQASRWSCSAASWRGSPC